MKAVRIHRHGGPEVLQLDDAPEPRPGPGEVLLSVHAAGVHAEDTRQRSGHALSPLPLPAILGTAAAGVITAVGAGVNPALLGLRAVGLAPAAQAEWVRLFASDVVLLPDGVDFEVAAVLPFPGLTAYHLLHTVEHITEGMTLLIHDIAGDVGLLILQLAKAAGARVLGTAASQARADVARQLGADAVLTSLDDLASAVRALTGGEGVNLFLDGVGCTSAEANLRCLAPLGHLVFFDGAGGHSAPIAVERLLPRALKVSAFSLDGPLPPEANRSALQELVSDVAAGTLSCKLGRRFALDQVAAAHRAVEEGGILGHVVLRVG